MSRIAVVIAVVARVLAGIAGAYALSVSNRLDDTGEAAAGVAELSNRLEDLEQTAAEAAQVSNLLDDVEQVAAHVSELDECMPEILDLIYTMQGDSSFGGTVFVYPSTNLSRRCADILSYAAGD